MAGDRYARVHSRFWIDPDIKALGRDARELYLYLMSSPHSNMAGYYYLPTSYVVEDMDTEGFPNPFETVRKGFQTLIQARKVDYDPASKVVLLRNALAWEQNPNPNQVKGILAVVREVPASVLLPEFVVCASGKLPAFAKEFETLLAGFRNPSGTLSNPGTVNSKQVQDQKDTSSGSGEPAGVLPVTDASAEITATTERQTLRASPEKPKPERPPRRKPGGNGDQEGKEPKWSEAARRLAKRMYDRRLKQNALPSDKGRFFQEQAGIVQAMLDKGRTEEELNAVFDWAEGQIFWRTRMKDWAQVDTAIMPQYRMEGYAHEQQRGKQPVRGGTGENPGSVYNGLSE